MPDASDIVRIRVDPITHEVLAAVVTTVQLTGFPVPGARGPAGPPGRGVPAGGDTGDVLVKNSSTDGDTHWISQAAAAAAVLERGAVGDGTADDTSPIQAAMDDAAANGGGPVLLPAGYTFGWRGDLVVPPGVSLVGAGSGKRTSQAKLLALSSDARLVVGERGDSGLNQGGVLRDLAIDGGGIADNPLCIGLAVTRSFENVTVMRSATTGVLVAEAQNCTFTSIDIIDSAGDALVFDGGTGGHLFDRLQIGGFGGYGVTFKASYVPDTENVYLQPTHITFQHPIIERGFGDGPAAGCVFASAADRVLFADPIMVQPLATVNGDPGENALAVLEYDPANGANLCELHFRDATFNAASLSAAARLEAQSGLFITGHTTINNCTPGIIANGGYANLDGHQIWANTPVHYGGSSSTDGIADGIFYTHREAPERTSRPTATQLAWAARVDGDAYDRVQILASGLIQFGTGAAAPTAQLFMGNDATNVRTNRRLVATDGVQSLTKAGAVSDADFINPPPVGVFAVDSTGKFWVKFTGGWDYVASSTAVGSAISAAIAAHVAATDPHGDRSYADTQIAAAVTGVFKDAGPIDCSANPNYPAASKGAAYVVTVAGKIGGASGTTVEVGDVIWATANNAGGTQAAVGANWSVLAHHLVGALLAANNLSDVANPATALGNLGGASTTYVNSGDATNAAAITAEASTARSAESALTTNLATEVTARTSTDAAVAEIEVDLGELATADSTEASARAAADATLTTNLAAEASTARAAESANATAITSEAATARAAEGLRELLSNKSTSGSLGSSDTQYPSQKAVKTYVDAARGQALAISIVFGG